MIYVKRFWDGEEGVLSGYEFLLHLHCNNCKKTKIKKEVVLCDDIDDYSDNELFKCAKNECA